MSRCNMTLAEHHDRIMGILSAHGIGGGCQTVYEVFLVCAEIMRRFHGYPSYDPGPEAQKTIERLQMMEPSYGRPN